MTAAPTDQRVRYGPGLRREAGAEAARLGASRPIVLSTPEQADLAEEIAGPIGAPVFAGAAMHTPTHVTERAMC